MRFVSTGKAQVRSVKCCVLYEPSTGQIRHVHHVVTLVGADETPEKAIEERILKLAKETGTDSRELHLLHVHASELEPSRDYKVDTKKRRLVALKEATAKSR